MPDSNPTSRPPTLRPGTPADVELILSLFADLARQHIDYDAKRWIMHPDVADAYRDWLAHATPAGEVFCRLAEAHEPPHPPLGYIIAEAMPADARYFTDPHVYIHDIYLAPAARGTGLAERLLAEVRTWALARGISQGRALIASPNAQSLAFFQKHHFRPTATEVSIEW